MWGLRGCVHDRFRGRRALTGGLTLVAATADAVRLPVLLAGRPAPGDDGYRMSPSKTWAETSCDVCPSRSAGKLAGTPQADAAAGVDSADPPWAVFFGGPRNAVESAGLQLPASPRQAYFTSGSAGRNGVFILLGLLLIVAWRVAGYLGADYFVLPALGTPWAPGRLFRRPQKRPDPAPAPAD